MQGYPFFLHSHNDVVAYGDGYAFTENYKADFDSVLYTYNICDNTGAVLERFKLTEQKDWYTFHHFGKGVFGYYTSPWDWKIYFPNSKNIAQEVI